MDGTEQMKVSATNAGLTMSTREINFRSHYGNCCSELVTMGNNAAYNASSISQVMFV